MIPIYLARPDQGEAPHTYVIHKYAQHCKCGSLHEYTKLYAKTHFKARMGHKYVTNLRPVQTPEAVLYNLPIEIITMPIERLPFCHECLSSQTLSHLPPPPATDTRSPALDLMNTDLVRNSPSPQEAAKKPAPKAKKAFSIDDL